MKKIVLKLFLTVAIAVQSLSSFTGIAYASNTTLSQNDLKSLLSGYTYYEVDSDGYINVETFTDAMKQQLGTGFFKQFHDREQIMMSFTTNSSFFSFEYKKEEIDDGYVDIFVDNVRANSIDSTTLDDEGTFSYNLDGNKHRVDIYLPRGGYMVRNFKVSEGADIASVQGRTKALFFGDSITYGYGLGCYADGYVNVMSRQMNYEVVNFGVGGYYFDGGQVIQQNVYTPDVIFVAYGTNDANDAGADIANRIAVRGKAFMDKVRALYPTQQINVITPVWASGPQNRIDYLDDARIAIENLCKSYSNVKVIDGLSLMPASTSYLSDEVHPNIAGNRLYGNNLVKALKGESGNEDSGDDKIGKGWSIKYEGQKSDRNTYFANTTEDAHFSSGKSMYVKYPDAAIADTYVELISGMTSPVTEGDEYEISFYLKGSFGTDTEVYVGNKKIMLSDMTKSGRIDASETPSGERNWVKYSYTLSDYEGAATTTFKFRIFSRTNGTYLDDVSIVGSDGVNLITDTSFDGIEEITTEVEPFDTTAYQATRMLASPGKGVVGLSWRNPETSDLSKVSVYNMTDGEEELVIDSLSTVPGDVVVYPVKGIPDGKLQLFMIRFDYENGASFKYYMSCTSGSGTYQGMLGEWNIWEYAAGTATYTPNDVKLDNKEFHSGEVSLKKTLNLDTADDPELKGNNYTRAYLGALTADKDLTYEIKMWLKGDNVGQFYVKNGWGNLSTGITNGAVSNFGDTKDWNEYTFTYNAKAGGTFTLNMVGETTGVVWIDDVSIYVLDEDGNPTGENLVKDGGFEGLLDTSVGDLEKAYITDIGETEMTLNWDVISSKVSDVNIYENVFGNYEYRGTVNKGIGSLKVTGLAMGEEYSYKLVPVNSMGVEGEGIEITAETKMPQYIVKTPVLKKGNFAVSDVAEAGNYSVTSEVNNYGTENMPYLQCVAVYKDGALEKIYPTEKVIQVSTKKTAPQKVTTGFSIEGEGNYSVKVYIFDNITDMNSYIPKTVFE